MAKTKHFKTVTFTDDFAIYKKGEDFTCDPMLASSLVREQKVAVYKDTEEMPAESKANPVITKPKNTKKK